MVGGDKVESWSLLKKKEKRNGKKTHSLKKKNPKTGRRPEEVCPSRGRGKGLQVRGGCPGRQGPAVGGGAGEERVAESREREDTERERERMIFYISVFCFLHFSIRFFLRIFFPSTHAFKTSTPQTAHFCAPLVLSSGCSAFLFLRKKMKRQAKKKREKNQNSGPLSGGPTLRLRNSATKPAATGAEA